MYSDEMMRILLHYKEYDAYLMDESLLIYSNKTAQVYGYEKDDAALFLEIDEYLSEYTPAQVLEKFIDLSVPVVKQMIDLAIGNEIGAEIVSERRIEERQYLTEQVVRTYYQSDDILFAIYYPSADLYDHIHPLFEHIHVEEINDCREVLVDIIPLGDMWEIRLDGVVADRLVNYAQLATFVQAKMMAATYESTPYLIALHAGAVERDGKVIVMPAASGSGKSTLTATLMHHGFTLFSDETVVLDDDGHVRPLSFGMNIKEGSWDILAPMYPELDELDTHSRFDGQGIRFLLPKKMHQGTGKATHMIFPKYVQDAETAFVAINANEALAKIQEATYQLQGSLDADKFRHILEKLIALPKYTLVYSDLDEAIGVIDRLLDTEKENR